MLSKLNMPVANLNQYTSVGHHVKQKRYIKIPLFFFYWWSYFLITRSNAEEKNSSSLSSRSSDGNSSISDIVRRTETDETGGELYPKDLFSEDELRDGAVIFHVVGVLYMFVALAIVCDEFFVPALGVITEKLKISEDVAGATFMAAGGSAPELFTSLIGTFFSKNDVGIGTIVGSAVFNILFVIGMCSFCSLTILTLTWWPLFRDICFYSVSLVCLIAFFQDSEIEVYESLILFGCYICYVIFMKYNEIVEIKVKNLISRITKKKVKDKSEDNSLTLLGSGSLHYRQRKSIAHILVSHDDQSNVDALSSKTPSVYQHIDTANRQAGSMSVADNDSDKKSAVDDGKLDTASVGGSEMSATDLPPKKGPSMSASMMSEGLPVYSEKPIATQVEVPPESKPDGSDEKKSSEEGEKMEMPEEESLPLDMTFPKQNKERVTYLLLFPIMFSLWITLPDVRRESSEKFFVFTFIGSILWIGCFSFCMVWWANTLGNTIGIPAEIMGITVLAAGTSVPDLITSVIVAKKGFGDMAVSSSVGSNIFDITVGLPIPWLLQAAISQGESYKVSSDGLFCSIVLLFGMLLAVVTSIAASNWKMKRLLGVCMMILYMIFVVFAVLLTKDIIECNAITAALKV